MNFPDFLLHLLLIVTGTILAKKIEMLVHKFKSWAKKKKGTHHRK